MLPNCEPHELNYEPDILCPDCSNGGMNVTGVTKRSC